MRLTRKAGGGGAIEGRQMKPRKVRGGFGKVQKRASNDYRAEIDNARNRGGHADAK